MVLFDQLLFLPANLPLAGQAPDLARSRSCVPDAGRRHQGGGCQGFHEDAEPALPLPLLCSSTGRSSVPRIAASPAGLRLGELSQQVPALTVAFPRDKEGEKF